MASKKQNSTEIVTVLNETLLAAIKENRKLKRQLEYLMNRKSDPKLEKQLRTMQARIQRVLNVMAGLPREKRRVKK
jgi:hypothetical protein